MKGKRELDDYRIEQISYVKNANMIRKIEKGFSFDNKYIIDDTYLLRTFLNENEKKRRQEFDYINIASNYSSFVPKGIEYNTLPEIEMSYMVLSYLPGTDGEEAIKDLTGTEQYNAGFLAGKELKNIHQVPAPRNYPSWYITKKKKSEKYLMELQQVNIEESIKELLATYIREHEDIMKDRPNTLQHDDFHPSNLLIHHRTFAGIIDFQRMDWGDPVHDLHKLGFFSKPISIEFTKGIIDGYHDNHVTDEFWRLYGLYSAMHVVSALVWGQRLSKEQYNKMKKYSFAVIKDHDNFNNSVPTWYR
ncbi:aminoglycoside phosphotransferase family protein [Ornithinibacillus salinisoli]|uniref:Aminoglycoside phosphotransferase family protein n=1 Tax=Ornithinibacillus salinisoli TaxID=1848459 RepID=A0ABW4W1H9_9BACI